MYNHQHLVVVNTVTALVYTVNDNNYSKVIIELYEQPVNTTKVG
jgi:hypothetical protein